MHRSFSGIINVHLLYTVYTWRWGHLFFLLVPLYLQNSENKERLKGSTEGCQPSSFCCLCPVCHFHSPELERSITSASTVMANLLCAPSEDCRFTTSALFSKRQTHFARHTHTRTQADFCANNKLCNPVILSSVGWNINDCSSNKVKL